MSESSRSRILRFACVMMAVLVVLAHPAIVDSVSAAGNGELTIDVEHKNGNQADEVNALIIYQDGSYYDEIKNYPGVDLKHTFSNLPTGHDYKVNAYIQDQFAGSTGSITIPADDGLTWWDESSKSDQITAENPIELSPTIYYSDGSTPIEGASVRVKSHEDDPNGPGKVIWRTATTESDGETDPSPLSLYPTDSDDPGKYTVEVLQDGEKISSGDYDELNTDVDLKVITDASVPEYDLSASADPSYAGDVDGEPFGSVEQGTEIQLTADPDSGHEFDHWSGDYPSGSREDADISVTVTEDKSLTAHFEEIPEYDLSVSSSSGGTVETSNTGSIQEGTDVSLTADATQGYKFSHWSGDYPSGSREDADISVTMYRDRELTANFEKLEGDLTVDVRHQNGDRAEEVNALVVWQDEVGGEPYKKFENDRSVAIKQKINNLPGDHRYKVNAYINDQFAGATDWVNIKNSDKSSTIRVENPVWIKPTVYYTDGSTPLEDATVKIESHEGTQWRSSTTEEDGITSAGKLWLFPTNKGHYDVQVYSEGSRVASKTLNSLDSNRDLRLVTSVSPPTQIDTSVVGQTVREETEQDGTITVGERTKVGTTVRNDGTKMPLRVVFQFDTDGDSEPEAIDIAGDSDPERVDYDEDGDNEPGTVRGNVEKTTVPEGEAQGFGLEYTPDLAGEWQVRAVIQAKPDTEWVQTDETAWKQYEVAGETEEAEFKTSAMPTSTFVEGEKLTTTATVKNTGTIKETFYIGYTASHKRSDQSYDVPPKSVTLNSGETEDVELTWTVPNGAPPGKYQLDLALWRKSTDDGLTGNLDRMTGTVEIDGSIPVVIKTVKFIKKSNSLSNPGRDEWVIGDKITLQIRVETSGATESYTGPVDGKIQFLDSADTLSGLEADWDDNTKQLVAIPFNQRVELKSSDDTAVIRKSVKIKNAFETTADADSESLIPSLTLTDQVRVSVGSTQLPRTRDSIENIHIRMSTLQGVNIALLLPTVYTGLSGSPKQAVAPGKEDVVVMAAEDVPVFTRAHEALRNENYDRYEKTVRNLLSDSYDSQTANKLASQLKSVAILVEKQKQSEAALVAAFSFQTAVSNSLFSEGTIYSNPSASDKLRIGIKRAQILANYLIGFVETTVNIHDLLGTVISSIEAANYAEMTDPEFKDKRTESNLPKYVQDDGFQELSGRVYTPDGQPLEKATVKIYKTDPESGSFVDPVAEVKTDSDGKFKTQGLSINHNAVWYHVFKQGNRLTELPRLRTNQRGLLTSGDPGPSGTATPTIGSDYEIYTDRTVQSPNQGENSILDITTSVQTRSVTEEIVEAKLTLDIQSGKADTSAWGVSSGIHFRVSGGVITNSALGAFDDKYQADRFNQSTTGKIKNIEFTSTSPTKSGEQLSTGWIQIEPRNGISNLSISHRGWAYDPDATKTINGRSRIHVARHPGGPTYNRHAIESAYTFLQYPVSGYTGNEIRKIAIDNGKLSGPSLSAPRGVVDSTQEVTLQWSDVESESEDDVTYDVYLGTGTDNPRTIVSEDISGTQTTVSVDPGGSYSWKVIAHRGQQQSSSTVGSFSVSSKDISADKFTPVQPTNGRQDTGVGVTLKWNAPEPDRYADNYVYLDTDPTTQDGKLIHESRRESTEIDNLDPDTTYYWQVVVENNGKRTAGPVWSFSTSAEDDGPVSVRFTDQTIPSGSSAITIDAAEFGTQAAPDGEFVVVVHKTTEETYGDGIGPKIGESDVLPPGTRQSVEVDLSRTLGPSDDIAELTKSQSLVAMLHRADTDDGDNINHGSHIARNGDKVTSRAQVTVSSPPDDLIADAGPDQTITAGKTVELDASGSTAPDNSALSYQFQQVSQAGSAPDVSLQAPETKKTEFTAPDVDSETTVTFELTVTNSAGTTPTDTDTDRVNITVKPSDPTSDQPLYTAGFESTPSGETPSDWTASGNSAIRVSNAQAADGTKSLRLSGSSGGCLETVGFGNLGQNGLFTQSTAGSVSFSDRFDDGTLNSQWEGAGINDPQVTESDGTLSHAVELKYNSDNNRLQTTQTFDATGTHRIEMRVRTTQSDYWGYGVALDGTNGSVSLKENKWERFNRFAVYGVTDRPDKYSSDYKYYGEQTHKAKLADATSETSFITYSLTVNFDTQTVTEVRRGSETWETDLQIKDIGDSYQLRIADGGHDVEYDAIAVGPADGDWSLFNDAANEQMPTPTSTSSSQSMNISFSVRPGGQAQTGCHDHNTGVNLNTGNDGTYGGKNIKLIEFTPDGSVEATFGENTPLGSYDVGTWTDVRVKYTPLKEGQARVAYFIDGEQRETITRGEPSFADQLSYLQVKTGEYTTYVDDINITTASSGVGDGDVDNPLPTTSLRFTDQTLPNGSSTVTVDTAQFGNESVPGEKFVVVVHKTTESIYDDEIGPKVGESDVLSPGTRQSVEVDLSQTLAPSDDMAELTKSQSLVAMLHRADTDDDEINHGPHITRNGDTVTSRAQVTVSPPPGDLVADAGPDQTVTAGKTVELDASGSTAPDESALTYAFQQVSQPDSLPDVSLQDPETQTPEFTAPDVDSETTLTFELTITQTDSTGTTTDTDTDTDTDQVNITITPADDPLPTTSLRFTDQTLPNGSSTVTVDTAQFGNESVPGEKFVVVVHKTTESIYDDEIGPKVGESDVLSPGTRQSVEVDLSQTLAPSDDMAELTESQSLVAMLHRADTTDGDGITHGAHITRDGDKVTSRAQLTVSSSSAPAPTPALRTHRNLTSTKVTNGSTVTVTVTGSFNSPTDDAKLVDIISGGEISAENLTITDAAGAAFPVTTSTPTPTVDITWNGTLGTVSEAKSFTVKYEVQIPADTPVGTIITFDGTVTDSTSGETTGIDGDSSIEVVATTSPDTDTDTDTDTVTVGGQEVPTEFTSETNNGDRTVTADNAVEAINTFIAGDVSADVAVDVINAFIAS